MLEISRYILVSVTFGSFAMNELDRALRLACTDRKISIED